METPFHTTLKARKGWGGYALIPPKLGGKDLLSANVKKRHVVELRMKNVRKPRPRHLTPKAANKPD